MIPVPVTSNNTSKLVFFLIMIVLYKHKPMLDKKKIKEHLELHSECSQLRMQQEIVTLSLQKK